MLELNSVCMARSTQRWICQSFELEVFHAFAFVDVAGKWKASSDASHVNVHMHFNKVAHGRNSAGLIDLHKC